MCDAYSQSTQHAQVVAWLERGPLLVLPDEDARLAASGQTGPAQQRRVSVRSLAGQAALLLGALAGAQALSVGQAPVVR